MNWLDCLLRRPAAQAEPPPSDVPLATTATTAAAATAAAPDGRMVIDVRSEPEFRQTALKGAVNLPLNRLAEGIQALAPDPATPVVLYCASGARSGMGCELVRRLGYQRVENAGGVFQAAAQLGRSLV